MKDKWKYECSDAMSDVVESDYRTLLVMSRFGMGLGFGDATVDEACRANGVDPETFLAVVRTTFEGEHGAAYDISKVSPQGLLDYLVSAHDYYLRYRFPAIRSEIVGLWEGPENDLFRVMINYYDDIVAEIRRHAKREEKEFFPYVRLLAEGKPADMPRIDLVPGKHHPIIERLDELKRILIKYYPARDTNRMNSVLFDLCNCEYDLMSHIRVEEELLFPIIANLERKQATRRS